MKTPITSLISCCALSLAAMGCATSDSYDRTEQVAATRYDETYQYRRRPNERLYEAPVTSARAVVGPPEERCWVEREQVPARTSANVGGAVAGAIVGGILGHQIGSGRGRDVATVGGAAVGGAIGANAGRSRAGTYERDVKHCETVASNSPDYWDVTYDWRGVQHRVQMIDPPGGTVMVNRHGEPRG